MNKHISDERLFRTVATAEDIFADIAHYFPSLDASSTEMENLSKLPDASPLAPNHRIQQSV